MKKILLVIAVVAIALPSCKKDYTCTCKDNSTTNTGDDVVIKYTKVKKKDAQKSCDAATSTYSSIDYSCKLD